MLVGDLPADKARSYLSGLLIGDETTRMTRGFDRDDAAAIVLIGEPHLCDGYGRALTRLGLAFETAPGEAPVVAGLHTLHVQRSLS